MPPKRKAPPKTKAATKATTTPKKGKTSATAASAEPLAAKNKSAAVSSKESPDTLFEQFSNKEERGGDAITLEGLSNLCAELGIDVMSDVRGLVLAWKLGGKERPGEINRTEFSMGMRGLGATTVEDLKAKTPSFDPGFMTADSFRDFFRFCFTFNLEGTFKTIEREIIVDLLPMAACDRSKFTDKFVRFLGTQNEKFRMSGDQWNSFLEFSMVIDENFTQFDEDAAWPCLIDEFVDWCKEDSK